MMSQMHLLFPDQNEDTFKNVSSEIYPNSLLDLLCSTEQQILEKSITFDEFPSVSFSVTECCVMLVKIFNY